MIAGEQQNADCLNLRIDHVGTQALSADYVGDETDAFAKKREWRERVGIQVWRADVRSVAIRIRSRPIRPIPLMPTRTRMSSPFLGCRCSHRGCVSAAAATVDRPFRWARGPCVRGRPRRQCVGIGPTAARSSTTHSRSPALTTPTTRSASATRTRSRPAVGGRSSRRGPPGTDVPDDARCARPDRPVSLDPVARRCIVDH